MEKMKRLYEKYKVNFDEQFKKDLLEVMINTYGEDCRKKFEEKINNIQVYTKFTVKKLKEYVEQHRGEEDFSLEEEVIAEYEKEECNKEILRRQYKLMDKVKKRLSPAEAYKLDTELQELVSSGRIPIEFSRVDLKMATLFEELGDFSVLEKIIDEHQLEDSSKTPNREEFVNDYFRDVIEINKDFDRKINKRYEIEDSNDYYIKSLETNKDFLKNFETAILTARHGNIDILLDVVGKQNFIEYAELQNKYYVPNSNQEAQALLKK